MTTLMELRKSLEKRNRLMKKPALKMEPLVRAVRKAYKSGPVWQVDKLLAEESRWKRKATIATNKLAAVRRKLNTLAVELAQELIKVKP